ncbi:MAG: PIN domain nuclease [Candidatus Wallbacteria bacterium HGW-Wallbacteria-1]|jgi:predicted nucleic acid-binding protein|uniref:PIN domain nuclease n=1 Tax=Candidatus Wallbacteria bacterium HGW-Wallbacteria-1 TaxID=2013854 RepID=A0A2N1PLQ4_9BACT|nr:MAG: PIN domain nuclease [Candidatus Wallbacteria bacterium HGW-Wallbacteria-1]
MKIIVDLNVIIDFLNKRANHKEAARIVDLSLNNIIDAYLCAHEITTLSYFLHKESKDRSKVKNTIEKLMTIFRIIPINKEILDNALNSEIQDYEDSVIEVSAIDNQCDFIVTQNIRDFKKSRIKPLSSSQFLVLLNQLH